MPGSVKSVCIVGGGIGSLVCAQTISHLSKKAGRVTNIVILEKSPRLGGQIKTHTNNFNENRFIIEEGAEGFVTRSEVFPRVASMAGLSEGSIIDQIRIADNELAYDSDAGIWRVTELPPGMAAQKLGFQVPARDRGKGIRSFRGGMSELVHKIKDNLRDVRINSEATMIKQHSSTGKLHVSFCSEGSILSDIHSDAVVLGIPINCVHRILGFPGLLPPPEAPQHNSHVSVHIMTPRSSEIPEPRSFTIPKELQDHFGGLRAVAFVNEKFAGRCPDDSWLFRFYYRPSNVDDVNDRDRWTNSAVTSLRDIFGLTSIAQTWYSPWSSALPIITRDHLDNCRLWKDHLQQYTLGRLSVVGSEWAGAGLEAAAQSGFEAGSAIFNRLTG
jgi:protoporphyrinogen oxidase